MKDPSSQGGVGERERAGKRFKSSGSLDLLRSQNNVGERATGRRKSQVVVGRSDVSDDFEQELNAALGLSPTEARPQHQTSVKPVLSSGRATDHNTQCLAQQSHDGPMNGIVATHGHAGASINNLPDTEKSLPVLPGQLDEGSASTEAAPPSRLGLGTLETTTPSIRPVLNDEAKPATPPKALPPKGLPPGVPPKDIPPKDLPPRDASLKNLSLKDLAPPPQSNRSQRQPSISTLGADERMASHPPEGEVETPPSPIQPSTNETSDRVDVKPLPQATISGTSLPSVEENNAGFTAMHPRRQSFAQILESKRRSISGMPGIQSPLRNEVRYSPGTRSSMLSFGSFGRRSTNSKGTRPGTPANELSHRAAESGSPAPNGDSKMDKLKSFGKRRRASVGDLLLGIQGNIQGGRQGLPEASKGKRTFSRISVSLVISEPSKFLC